MWITKTSIQNPVFATMVMVALVVLGMFSYRELGMEAMPNVDIPGALIEVNYPGASPEAVENDITRPIEEVVNTVSGIKTLRANSWEGRGAVYVDFDQRAGDVDVGHRFHAQLAVGEHAQHHERHHHHGGEHRVLDTGFSDPHDQPFASMAALARVLPSAGVVVAGNLTCAPGLTALSLETMTLAPLSRPSVTSA